MEVLKDIVDEALGKLEGLVPADKKDEVAKVIEAAAIRGMLESQHQAVDACKDIGEAEQDIGEAEQDIAHKIATAIRRKNDALIVNLSAMR